MKESISICWFRRDLRIHDNNAFFQALNGENSVLPLFIYDSDILDSLPNKEDARLAFIHEQLVSLNKILTKNGSSVYTSYGKPLEVFEKLSKEFDIKTIYCNKDYEPYARQRDAEILAFAERNQIKFLSYKDQVIFEESEIMKADGKPYTIYTPYSKIWKQKFFSQEIPKFASQDVLSNLVQNNEFPFLNLEDIGFKNIESGIEKPSIDKSIIKDYHNTRNIPSIEGTTRLSIHLRFGTVSVRELAKITQDLNETWLNELIWREFFMMILFHFPNVMTQSFKPKYDRIEWRNNEEEFAAWCSGNTGYPIVDAGMRQLNKTGWMHNRVRMVVASFLIKHLLIDWRWGEAYFAEKLLDYDLSANNGNWQWTAGSGCDSAPYFRIFNPTLQTKRFDPKLEYIRKWIPNYDSQILPEIVEHQFARERVLQTFKKALADT